MFSLDEFKRFENYPNMTADDIPEFRLLSEIFLTHLKDEYDIVWNIIHEWNYSNVHFDISSLWPWKDAKNILVSWPRAPDRQISVNTVFQLYNVCKLPR